MDFKHDWDHELEAFLKSSPPRMVPESIRKSSSKSKGQMIMGILFGSVFLLMGSFFCYGFLPRHAASEWKLNHKPVVTVAGKVSVVEETNSSENKNRVYEYRFSYPVKDGPEKQGIAYTTGNRWAIGETIRVRYLEKDPAIAMPEGARLDPFSKFVFFVALFPILGVVLIVAAIFSAKGNRGLLSEGIVAQATIDLIEASTLQQQNNPAVKVHLTKLDDGTAIKTRVSGYAEIRVLREKYEARQPITILYDRKKPKRFLLPEAWFSKA